MELHAKYTLFCEGARGHLARQLSERFKLRDGVDPQVHGLAHEGVVGNRPPRNISRDWSFTPPVGLLIVIHAAAPFSITSTTTLVTVGFVVGLGYSNPYLLAFRGVPALQDASFGAQSISKEASASHMARGSSAGSVVSLPKLCFPEEHSVGDDAGFLNVSRIKGSPCGDQDGHASGRRRV